MHKTNHNKNISLCSNTSLCQWNTGQIYTQWTVICMYTSSGAPKRQSRFLLTALCFKTSEEYVEKVQQEWSNYSVLSGGAEFQIKGDTTSGDTCWLDNAENVHTFLFAGFLWRFCQHLYNRAPVYEEQIYFNHVYLLNSDDIKTIGMRGVQIGLPSKPKCVKVIGSF